MIGMDKRLLTILSFILLSCSVFATPAYPTPVTVVDPTATVTVPTQTPPTTATLAPYEQFSIDYLRKRTYGGGGIEIF